MDNDNDDITHIKRDKNRLREREREAIPERPEKFSSASLSSIISSDLDMKNSLCWPKPLDILN